MLPSKAAGASCTPGSSWKETVWPFIFSVFCYDWNQGLAPDQTKGELKTILRASFLEEAL